MDALSDQACLWGGDRAASKSPVESMVETEAGSVHVHKYVERDRIVIGMDGKCITLLSDGYISIVMHTMHDARYTGVVVVRIWRTLDYSDGCKQTRSCTRSQIMSLVLRR